jgi:hypothetical protein
MMRKLPSFAVCVLAACLFPLQAPAAPRLQLASSLPSPQPTGTTVGLTATATDPDPGVLAYRYSIAHGGASRIVRDFSQDGGFDLAGMVGDGLYLVQVVVRNNSTHLTAKKSLLFRFDSRVVGNQPVASATENPLVALFSAPACARGSRIRVKFSARTGTPTTTDWRACDPASSNNIYVAGMRQHATYSMSAQVRGRAGIANGPALSFTTGGVPPNLPDVVPVVPANAGTSLADGVLVTDSVGIGATVGYPFATDLLGRPVWYYAAFDDPAQAGGLLTRVLPGGTMLVLANGKNASDAMTQLQILREIDLAGHALRETNASRIREQLDAMGLESDCTPGGTVCASGTFHHDAIRLPNGHTVVLLTQERMYPAGTQGSSAPIDILGDVVVDLDQDFQVAWFWDSFAHLDVDRAAILGETCTPGFQACPPLFLASVTNDWLHPNTLEYTSDHNLVISLRHQDWVIKVDYRDGAGDGHVLWRLGAGGDFSLASNDPYPWFTHQHDAGLEADGTFTVFDNGNTRVFDNPGTTENSRGQVYRIDEDDRVATPLVNADLGVYSSALGSAQPLGNGNYHFLAGFLSSGPTQYNQSIEALPDGTTNLRLQAPGLAYRSFRMRSLYAPPGT